jgi:hypothetical protein
MDPCETLAKILNIDGAMLERLDKDMVKRACREGVLAGVCERNQEIIEEALNILNSKDRGAPHVRSVLRNTVLSHEKELLKYLALSEGKDAFEKAAALAGKIAKVGNGFFLKREKAEEILKKCRPDNLLDYLELSSVDELFKKHDVAEAFAALRFVESDEWMHETFEKAYSDFTPADFEERGIIVRVLGPIWKRVAEKFVEKKHHNVSHLKEFGVIFINPIEENIPGKFLRDFALLLHYFHEIEFYSKLFRKYAVGGDFAEKLKMLLRGDVPEIYKAEPGEWLIVQRYLAKTNPEDPRLYLPRINPESLHWLRGERDLAAFESKNGGVDSKLEWHKLEWVGGIFDGDDGEVVSFDLEDNAMSLVSFMEGKNESLNYHQREAMWTKMFMEYAGGEAETEKLLIENFDKGVIKF